LRTLEELAQDLTTYPVNTLDENGTMNPITITTGDVIELQEEVLEQLK
jgi:hypothetical protein